MLGLVPGSPLLSGMLQKGILVRGGNGKAPDQGRNGAHGCAVPAPRGTGRREANPKAKGRCNLLQTVETASVKETAYFTAVTEAVLRTLELKGFFIIMRRQPFASRQFPPANAKELPSLTPEQDRAYHALLEDYTRHEPCTAPSLRDYRKRKPKYT